MFVNLLRFFLFSRKNIVLKNFFLTEKLANRNVG